METIEQAFQEVCKLHEQITQMPAPEIGPQAFLPFPPGIDPVAFAIEEVSQLKQMYENGRTMRPQAPQVSWIPRACIYASDCGVLFLVELSGVAKEDVSVSVTSGEMIVRGQRRAPAVDSSLKPVMVEHAWGAFERRFPVPPWCTPEKIRARYAQGVLEISLSRLEEAGSGEFHVEIA